MKKNFWFALWMYSASGISSCADRASNIVIVLVGDLGWGDVGFHGSEIKTPVWMLW